ncbi:MAG: polymer-forming cytoskeletal protein [Wenzhouxiangellaceae bacterium]|nr:polymer-forming cytoskeletal protein [Wenzhouxiangellaceae bacterium]
MAVFGKNSAQQSARNGSTIIAAGTQFIGDLTLSDNLHVDGKIEGNVDSESNVTIGSEGALKGQIKASRVVVSGRVDGTVIAERLEIIAGGTLEGNVQTIDLVIEPGGRFNGSSEIVAADQLQKSPERKSKAGVDEQPAKTSSSKQSSVDLESGSAA